MKKSLLMSVALLASFGGVAFLSVAGNSAFPPVDERVAEAERQPSRFFVKYFSGKEAQTRDLIAQHQLEVVDFLPSQQVLVVSGSQEQIDQLSSSEWIDYTEPEPVRSLYSQ